MKKCDWIFLSIIIRTEDTKAVAWPLFHVSIRSGDYMCAYTLTYAALFPQRFCMSIKLLPFPVNYVFKLFVFVYRNCFLDLSLRLLLTSPNPRVCPQQAVSILSLNHNHFFFLPNAETIYPLPPSSSRASASDME